MTLPAILQGPWEASSGFSRIYDAGSNRTLAVLPQELSGAERKALAQAIASLPALLEAARQHSPSAYAKARGWDPQPEG